MRAHRARHASSRPRRRRHITAIRHMRPATRLVRPQKISARQNSILLHHKNLMPRREPERQCLLMSHLPRQRIRLTCPDHRLQHEPNSIPIPTPRLSNHPAILPQKSTRQGTPPSSRFGSTGFRLCYRVFLFACALRSSYMETQRSALARGGKKCDRRSRRSMPARAAANMQLQFRLVFEMVSYQPPDSLDTPPHHPISFPHANPP
jgi:hypothetical protein